jgi:glycosyltransferase involved in cell wall biosynthesis
LEVLVVDGGSEDRSRDIASSFHDRLRIRIVDNSIRREAEWGKGLALREATGELFQCMDADMWLTSTSMLRSLATPLYEDSDLAGTIARYAIFPGLSAWSRFLALDPFQRDPLIERLTPDIEPFITEMTDGYAICEFPTPRIPPVGGTTMFRRSEIDLARWGGYFSEIDHPAYLIMEGRGRFAYVEDAAWAHDHCRSLLDLVRKRLRNLAGLDTSVLARANGEYTWVALPDRREKMRLVRWILGTNLVLPRAFEGCRQALRLCRWEPLLRPVVALAVTDAILFHLLTSRAGRDFMRTTLIGRPVGNGL